jgi:hypothetical protein
MTDSMWGNMTPVTFLQILNWNDQIILMMQTFRQENEQCNETICTQLHLFYQNIHKNYAPREVTSPNQFRPSDENETTQLSRHDPR